MMKKKIYRPEITADRCNGCGMCVAICPEDALSTSWEGGQLKAILAETDNCDGCGVCSYICTKNAIEIHNNKFVLSFM